MKKLIYCAVALAAALFAGSCQQELMSDGQNGNAVVSFKLNVPGAEVTRANIGDGSNVDILYYEVYNSDYSKQLVEGHQERNSDGSFDLNLTLVSDNTYNFLFWAQVDGKDYYKIDDLRSVEVKYTSADNVITAVGNAEDRAAFFAAETIELKKTKFAKTITLKRPFAQLNFGTLSLKSDITDFSIIGSTIKVTNVSKKFDVSAGVGSSAEAAQTEVTFKAEGTPSDPTLTVNETSDYDYLSMNYFFVPGDEATVEVNAVFHTSVGDVTHAIPYVPVAENYRTNVIGDLIFSTTELHIVIDEKFSKPDIVVDYMKAIPETIDLGNGNSIVIPALSADHKVAVSGKGTLTLEGVNILATNGPAIVLEEGADVQLVIKGEVSLTGASDGIRVPAEAKLEITGENGTLVTVGNVGSGIKGSVTIDGLAHITAKGNGDHAYGIGAGDAKVIIRNSTVDYACGGHVQPLFINDEKYGKSEPEGGAAIGGSEITIENSTVIKADGGSKAAAIGAEYWHSTEIEIINSTIEEANGGNASAGIGGSRYAGDAKYNVSIKITDSNVTATGGQYGAGIGSGYDTHCNGQSYSATNHIEIDGTSVINAKGGKYASGIGTGFHSAYLTGSIAYGVTVNSVAGDEIFYKSAYTIAQNIGYGIVDPAREFSGDNADITFTVAGNVIDGPVSGVVVTDKADVLTEAFANGEDIVMSQDIETEAATTAPYGNKYAFKMDGGVLDGNGHELYMECYGDDYGIMISAGTIKNLTITEGCRAVMIMYPKSDIILDNVKIGGDGVLYPINTGEAGAAGVKLIVTNSVLAGWTSYGNIESASFTNVEFKQGTYYNDINGRVLKPYVNTTLTDCAFVEHMNIDLSALAAGHKITMSNCTVNGQPVDAGVFTIPSNDAQYDTELFTVDLPSWATSINDCMIFN